MKDNLTPDPDSQQFQIMETLDERQIVAEISGQMAESWVYSFPQDGKTVKGLSFVGVKEAVRQLNESGKTSIRISSLHAPIIEKVNEDHMLWDADVGEGFVAKVYGEDVDNGGGIWASKFEPINKKKKDGTTYKNPFAYEHALSKAQRNAMRALIPETLFAAMIDHFIKKGKGATMTEVEAREVVGTMGKKAEKFLAKITQCKKKDDLMKMGGEIAGMKAKKEITAKELATLQSVYSKKLGDFIRAEKATPPKNEAKNTNTGGDTKPSGSKK